MCRLTLLVGLAIACGCGPSGDRSSPPPNEPAEASAFRLDEVKQVIYLDTRIAPGQQRRFDMGQGSITIETLHVKDQKLTFLYTPEVEGGYTTYECTVRVSPTPVEFKINPDGTPGPTSFDLSACKRLREGNLLLD